MTTAGNRMVDFRVSRFISTNTVDAKDIATNTLNEAGEELVSTDQTVVTQVRLGEDVLKGHVLSLDPSNPAQVLRTTSSATPTPTNLGLYILGVATTDGSAGDTINMATGGIVEVLVDGPVNTNVAADDRSVLLGVTFVINAGLSAGVCEARAAPLGGSGYPGDFAVALETVTQASGVVSLVTCRFKRGESA